MRCYARAAWQRRQAQSSGIAEHRRASCSAAIAAFAALTALLALARFASVHNRTFDLALYARLAWGLVHGQAWDPIVGGSFLGGHLPFVLLPLGAARRALGTVPVLLVAQSVALALAAWPLSLIGARRLRARRRHRGGARLSAVSEPRPRRDLRVPPRRARRCCRWLRARGGSIARAARARARALVGCCLRRRRVPREPLAADGGHRRARAAHEPRARVAPHLRSRCCRLARSTSRSRVRAAAAVSAQALAASADLHYGKWGGSPLGVLPRAAAHAGARVRPPARAAAPQLSAARARAARAAAAARAALPARGAAAARAQPAERVSRPRRGSTRTT